MSDNKNNDKKDVVYFYCETSLKAEFYKLAQEKGVSPSSILRAFMRKTVKTWEEEKLKTKDKDNK